MTSKQYIGARLLRKQADSLLRKEANWFTDLFNKLFGYGEKFVGKALEVPGLILPLLGVAGGYGLAKATSPRGVAENASDLAINAMERASLAESLRDLETLKANNKIRKQTRKSLHDQFI